MIYLKQFTQDSDPIEDMGIGGFSYSALSQGAVIKVNPNYSSGIAVT